MGLLDGGDQGAGHGCVGQTLYLGAVFFEPWLFHPLGQHPDIDVDHGELVAEEVGPDAQRIIVDLVVALDIGAGSCL